MTALYGDDGSTERIPLRARDGSVRAYVLIDAADATTVNQRRWHLNRGGYAVRSARVPGGGYTTILLHRVLLGLTLGDDLEGDHRDRNKLNCRRENLRIVPVIGRANQQNLPSQRGSTSPHRGVSWDAQTRKWRSKIYVGGKTISLGRFSTQDAAADAARLARLRLMPFSVD